MTLRLIEWVLIWSVVALALMVLFSEPIITIQG